MKKIMVSWSGGKDSTLMLAKLLQDPEYEVSGLFTSINKEAGLVPFHGIPVHLLAEQAASLNLPIDFIPLPPAPSNKEYEDSMGDFLKSMKENRAEAAAFGDIFLEDIKYFREELVSKYSVKAVFPLWGEETEALASHFIRNGFKAIISGIDESKVPFSQLGRLYNDSFLKSVHTGTDPCGENGEFHTFVYGGPIFKHDIPFVFRKPDQSSSSFSSLEFLKEPVT
ncbi:adenine nucleotide alpha hydrolase [Bacillus sp. FJAT-42376]|uniref:adenine nucleotide alpha hydrolase n=1 Tax=Bacillus sp. FJAT-42376 TaxID=2014076 RepID=UPI0013DE3018|nr:adenine nucleotide alpha hydrolase [Bacillus sp. FJAT-42376]